MALRRPYYREPMRPYGGRVRDTPDQDGAGWEPSSAGYGRVRVSICMATILDDRI